MGTYRLDGRQLGLMRRTMAKRVAVAGAALLIPALIGRHPEAYASFGAIALLGVFFVVAARFSVTTLSEDGIRSRSYGLWTRTCPWSQVADIRVRHFQSTVTIRVVRTDGSRFTLGAPVTGALMPDPHFDAKADQIMATWQQQMAGHWAYGATPQTNGYGRRIGLAATSVVLWGVVPLLLLVGFVTAQDSQPFSDSQYVHAVVTSVDASFEDPVYQLAPVPGSVFPASAISTSPTVAYCALMDGRTKVGDTVELVYPKADPKQMEDVRLVSSRWEAGWAAFESAPVLAVVAFFLRRVLARPYRIRRRREGPIAVVW